jgi:hypothetical protein
MDARVKYPADLAHERRQGRPVLLVCGCGRVRDVTPASRAGRRRAVDAPALLGASVASTGNTAAPAPSEAARPA